jgi:CubicO group peptidase (beta-lactamase class C family)
MADSYFPASDRKGGWRRATSARKARREAGVDLDGLEAAFDYARGNTKNGGLVVVRHGWLAYEKYFGKGHAENAPNLASCGKSFTSIATGILMAEYPEFFPKGLDQEVFRSTHLPPKAFPLVDKRKADIKLGQLLSFTAGIRGNNPCYVDGKPVDIDPLGPDGWQGMEDGRALGVIDDEFSDGRPFTAKTLWCDPGGGYSYATASIHTASIIVRHLAQVEMETYLRERVGNRIGWEGWGFGYKNTEARSHTPGGGGIAIRGTDMARFLYMLLHGGAWDSEQIVPESYVRQCANPSPYNPHFPYSLQFTVNAMGEAPAAPRDAYWKAGSGGHALCVVPSLDLVVWKLGGRDEQYSEKNTGLPEHSTRDDREGWEKLAEDDGEALKKTLEMVCASVVG